MRELILSNQAQIHILEIQEYTTNVWGLKQSDKYLNDLYQTNLLLVSNPMIGVQRKDIQQELFSFPHGNHMIYYKFNNQQLFILDILHKNMLPKKHSQNK